MFRVIEGGLSQPKNMAGSDREQIEAEGRRRLSEAGVDHYRAREILTGVAMPSSLRAFMLQVEFAVGALSTLSPVPVDICDNGYWPTHERAAPLEAAQFKR